MAALAGCATDSSSSPATDSGNGAPPDGGGGGMGGDSGVEVADGEIPEETAGPFPGDGSNGPNVLTESGVVRSDITASFGDEKISIHSASSTLNSATSGRFRSFL